MTPCCLPPFLDPFVLATTSTSLEQGLVSDGAKHGLGKFLRDVCSKVVPLIRVLEMRRDTVQKHLVSTGRGRDDRKFKNTEVNQDDGKSLSAQGPGNT